MAGEDAQKEPEFPANAGRDVLGSIAERRYDGSARDGHWCNRSHDPAMDSQSQRESESPPARITASGLLGGPMRAWDTNGYSTRRPPVALPVVRCDGNSEPSGISSGSEARTDAAPQVDTERGEREQGRLGTPCDWASQYRDACQSERDSTVDAIEFVNSSLRWIALFVVAQTLIGIATIGFVAWGLFRS